jgi:hypothetical protein
MRKYVLLNRDPPYDSEILTKGLLGFPRLLMETDLFRTRIIDLAEIGYKDEDNKEKAEVYSAFIRSYCEKYTEILKNPDTAEQVKNYCSNITAIANIKYQMGNFYFKNLAVPKYMSIISEMNTKDPELYVINAPELAKYTVNSYNIIISEYYAARNEYERLEELKKCGAKESRIVWSRNGAGFTLPYAVSMLKIGTVILRDVKEMDNIMSSVKKNISEYSTYVFMPDCNFSVRVQCRSFDIRSVYTNYSVDEIEKESVLSPVKIGELPSDREIIKALAEISP